MPHSGNPEEPDELPPDLDVTAVSGRYTFPDVRRRRIAGWIYVAGSVLCLAGWAAAGESPLVNPGLLGVSLALLLIGAYHLATAFPLAVREVEALVAAAREVGFPVGHASAQLGWRGLLSRPTWRILLYSGEEPPAQRGLVLVDAVDGSVVSHFVEANPEDWSAYDR
ncbi:MAG: hypothetical protein M3314_00930 [Actinomycetota bacterium]|nr:hypothetical protein [Actinomycetota bacterium]